MKRGLRAHTGLALAGLVTLALLGGCATVTDVKKILFTPRLRECRGFDVPLSVFIGPSRKELRARVVARNVDYDVPFVVETTADSFVLVGFTPLGTKAFTLERRGDDLENVEVESFVGPGLTVPPANLMEDVLAMSTPSACGTSASEVGVTRFEHWEVQDTCSGGRLVVRDVFRLDSDDDVDAAGQSVLDAAGQTTEAGDEATGQSPEEVLDDQAPAAAEATGSGEATAASPDQDEAETAPGWEIEITYNEDGIIVYQKRCRYRARYVLQATPTEVVAEEEVAGNSGQAVAAPVAVPATEPAATPAAAPAAASTAPAVSGEAAE